MTTQEVLHTIFEGGDTDAEEIKKRYPYFKLIHLYNYLKDPQSKQNRQMAGLHFTQHYWLQGLTSNSIAEDGGPAQTDHPVEQPVVFPHETVLDEVMNTRPEELDLADNSREEKAGFGQPSDLVPEPGEQIHEVDNPLPTVEPVTVNEPVENAGEAARQSNVGQEDALRFEVKKNDDIVEPRVELAVDLETYRELTLESEDEMDATEQLMEEESKIDVHRDDMFQDEDSITHTAITALTGKTLLTAKQQVHEVENPLPAEEPVSVNEPRKSLNDTPSPHLQLAQKEDTTTEKLVFEPLHTTDYFASQGIKITDEAMSSDKIGKQLKSFTQWLKTMKRLPGTPDQNINKGKLDFKVVSLAENSNMEEEIVTESMAKAYIQQGKIAKAREIYRKLTLIYPEKSTYFAALIEKS